MDFWYILRGACHYEFRMQIRRLALWATFAAFAALVIAVAGQGNWAHWSGEKDAFDSFANKPPSGKVWKALCSCWPAQPVS